MAARAVSIHAPTQGATSRWRPRPWPWSRFNPRTHAGCDRRRWGGSNTTKLFQSTHPRRVRLLAQSPRSKRSRSFNPRTHAGCDKRLAPPFLPPRPFQSTHPRRVRRRVRPCRVHHISFQSTHPRRVRPAWRSPRACRPGRFNPRTHAGCDYRIRRVQVVTLEVSIHAPTQGATCAVGAALRVRCCFNPRTHAGCDRGGAGAYRADGRVSIHAPTQGATRAAISWPCSALSFNPRTHAGCDLREGRHGRNAGSFNPRTHAGCDAADHAAAHLRLPVSIHAPTQGATASS